MRFALLLGMLLVARSAAAAEVRLRESASCSSAVVRLMDVAEIHADDPALATALAEIPLGPAPAAGGEQTLSQHEVRQLLALSGVARADVQVTGSERVVISAATAGSSVRSPRGAAVTGVRQAVFDPPAAKKGPLRSAPAARPQAAVAPVNLVERGTGVSVYARKGGAVVRTSGKALAAGVAGETILIEIEGGKEKMPARVVAQQAVEVEVP